MTDIEVGVAALAKLGAPKLIEVAKGMLEETPNESVELGIMLLA